MIVVPIKDASITELNFVTVINSNDPFVMLGIVVSVEIKLDTTIKSSCDG